MNAIVNSFVRRMCARSKSFASALAGALTVAVTVGLVVAAPVYARPEAGTEKPTVGASGVSIYPRPQQVRVSSGRLTLPTSVAVVRGAKTDQPALSALTAALRAAGVRRVVVGTTPAPGVGLTIYLGGPAENTATDGVLRSLSIAGPKGLAAEGYVLNTGRVGGRQVAVLAGADPAGTFYAVQSMRQLLEAAGRPGAGQGLPVLTVRDWPATQTRGVIEGFYGTPWSQADRLDQLAFYGRQKMNTYEYSAKDDPYLRERWRDQYPADEVTRLKELVSTADAQHVRFAYALSPGLSVCYSSDSDISALNRKFEQMYAIGIRTFVIPLDDISYTKWNCAQDGEKFGSGPAAAGAAQAYLLNQVNAGFVQKKADVRRLETVATEYYTITDSPYKTAIREKLDRDVIVMWTGTAVVPTKITVAETNAAKKVFGHDMLLWDNYPVNDYMRGRLGMAPYQGREDGVARAQVGIVANPMNQAATSKIGLFGVADFAWNDKGYDPKTAWTAGATQYARGDARVVDALRWFADAENWMETIDPVEAPRLAAAIADFWRAWQARDRGGVATFERQLRAFTTAPAVLRAGVEPAFARESKLWLDAMKSWGDAMTVSLDMLRAQRAGDGRRAWADRQRIPALVKAATAGKDPVDGKNPIRVATTVADVFVRDALASNDRWFGLGAGTVKWTASGGPPAADGSAIENVVDRKVDSVYTASRAPKPGEELTLVTATPVNLAAIAVATPSGGRTAASVEARTVDGIWRPAGRIVAGYSELRLRNLTAKVSAVRVKWSSTSTVPAVAEIVPIAADTPVAVSVTPPTIDVEIGTDTKASVTVDGVGLSRTSGNLTFAGPAGVSVSPASTKVTVDRGDRQAVPVTVRAAGSAPLGAGKLTATLAGRAYSLPIHVYPKISDRNVALASNGATASASCVELNDPARFGAPFANDGDEKTRWSSCYDDNSWWSVKLAAPTRLSKVVMKWEASYASAYKLQVSTDGQTWTTVADRPRASGGVESVRFDAVTAGYLRMQGVKRTTTFGYSFYEFEAFPVA